MQWYNGIALVAVLSLQYGCGSSDSDTSAAADPGTTLGTTDSAIDAADVDTELEEADAATEPAMEPGSATNPAGPLADDETQTVDAVPAGVGTSTDEPPTGGTIETGGGTPDSVVVPSGDTVEVDGDTPADDALPSGDTVEADGDSPADDALPSDETVEVDGDTPADDESTTVETVASDADTPANEEPSPEGIAGTDEPVIIESAEGPAPDDGTPTAAGVITADNYAELVSQTFSLARVVFGDGSAISETLLEFAEPVQPFLFAGPPVVLDETLPCLGGGEFDVDGPSDGPDSNLTYAFTDCVAAPGIASGSFTNQVIDGGSPGGGHVRNYGVNLVADLFGAEVVGLDGQLTLEDQGSNPSFTYTVASYSAAGPSYSLNASGSGTRLQSDFGLPFSEQLAASLQVEYTPEDTQPAFVFSAVIDPVLELSPAGDGALPGGAITIIANDDSSVTVSASDVPQIASVVIFDTAGIQVTTDSRPWVELF